MRFLVAQRADGAADGNLTAVDGQGFQVEIFAPDDQNAACCVQYDGILIKALYLAHAGDGQLFTVFQPQLMGLCAI